MMTAFLNGKVMLLSNKQRKLKVTFIMATLHKKKNQFLFVWRENKVKFIYNKNVELLSN